jgi:hypothetical protein
MPQQQQEQEHANYDLLAVFSDEIKATAAETKLHKEGFNSDEVFRLPSDYAKGGEYLDHGPNRERSAVFLQTIPSGPNPVRIVAYAIILGLVLGLLMFVAHSAFASIQVPLSAIAGAIVGVILGAVLGFLQRGRTRGAIGQDLSKVPMASKKPTQSELNVIAIRLPEADNITRKSRARAILLTNGGKIDRSASRN